MLVQQGPHWGFCQRVPAPLSWALTQWPKGRSHQKCDITGDHGAAGARKLVDDFLETTLDSSVFASRLQGVGQFPPNLCGWKMTLGLRASVSTALEAAHVSSVL